MRMDIVVQKQDGKGVVHGINLERRNSVETQCGHELDTLYGVPGYRKLRVHEETRVTCKKCLKSMATMPVHDDYRSAFDRLKGEEEHSTVMDGKDIFYEVRMKDGSHEVIYDVMSAQEAADRVIESFDISLSEIECIHKIGVLKAIFPTTTVSFVE